MLVARGNAHLKRKYGDRSNWMRVLEREYTQSLIKDRKFTLLHFPKNIKIFFYEDSKSNTDAAYSERRHL